MFLRVSGDVSKIAEHTYRSKSLARQAFLAEDALLIHLANGLIRVDNQQAVYLTHPLIDENMTLQILDPHTCVFIGPYKIVAGRL